MSEVDLIATEIRDCAVCYAEAHKEGVTGDVKVTKAHLVYLTLKHTTPQAKEQYVKDLLSWMSDEELVEYTKPITHEAMLKLAEAVIQEREVLDAKRR